MSSSIVQLILDLYRLIQTLWNAYFVLLQVIQSVVKEAQQEAVELMEVLEGGSGSVMDAMTTALTDGSASPWQMLILSRASSFVFLLRLSKTRVLQLEVDEAFIAAKLEVIKTDLLLDIRHVPSMLHPSIRTHDTSLVKYTPTTMPYVWKECCQVMRNEGVEGGVAAADASPVVQGDEGGNHRKKYIQLLVEGARRRRLHIDRFGEVVDVSGSKKGLDVDKAMEGRRALADITIGNVIEAESGQDKLAGGCPATPKQVRTERNMHTALTENLSIARMVEAASVRKSLDNLRRTRRQELYSRRSIGSFKLVT